VYQYAHARHGVIPERREKMTKPRCGAKTRRGTPCQAAAIWSTRSQRHTRCKNHGGLSTGPRTAEGIERIRRAVTKHGRYSAAAKADGSALARHFSRSTRTRVMGLSRKEARLRSAWSDNTALSKNL